ncbi:MAG: hypothetical protein LBV16_05660 [Elusimicrobiota bacterium]|jgi:hypothetical protein|nr:hypothetical protein [Elusimicrobiota bacterium]
MNLADNKSNEVSAVLLNNYLGLLSSLSLEYQMQLSQRLSYNISISEKNTKFLSSN